VIEFHDRLHGIVSGLVDDVVLRRNDGVPAYNLAVVVDDEAQAVTEVVRGDDLSASTARQIHLQELLGYARPMYMHVPLVVDATGERLAKRSGMPMTMTELGAIGIAVQDVIGWIGATLGYDAAGSIVTLRDLLAVFDPGDVPIGSCALPSFALPM